MLKVINPEPTTKFITVHVHTNVSFNLEELFETQTEQDVYRMYRDKANPRIFHGTIYEPLSKKQIGFKFSNANDLILHVSNFWTSVEAIKLFWTVADPRAKMLRPQTRNWTRKNTAQFTFEQYFASMQWRLTADERKIVDEYCAKKSNWIKIDLLVDDQPIIFTIQADNNHQFTQIPTRLAACEYPQKEVASTFLSVNGRAIVESNNENACIDAIKKIQTLFHRESIRKTHQFNKYVYTFQVVALLVMIICLFVLALKEMPTRDL